MVLFLADEDDAEAEQDRHDDDLKHIGVHHRIDEVGREDADDGIHKRGRLGRLIAEVGGRDDREEFLEDVAADKADGDGERGGAQVVQNGFQADRTDLADVAHRNDAAHDGEQHDGDNDELNEVEENRAERLDVADGKFRVALQEQTCDDGKHKRDEDACRKGGFFLFFHD